MSIDTQHDKNKLSAFDGVAFVVGVVVGIGIFGFPPLVAANVDSGTMYMLAWLAGGLVMLVGALTYAELGSAFPSAGGEYHFLSRAYGHRIGMLFAWARGTVVQTGAIAVVAFIYGEYANILLPLGPYGDSIHAAISVLVLTALNLAGTGQSKRVQIIFTIAAVLAVLTVIVAGVFGSGSAASSSAPPPPAAGSLGMAMVFVLLTYGGWNEAAYLSGEMRNVKRDMTRVMVWGTVIVVALYACVNLAFLNIFGLAQLRETHAVGAALMEIVAGPAGAVLLSLLVCLTALSTINGTIFTGARVYYALGRDVPALKRLGAAHGTTPSTALLVQAAITLALIVFGAFTHGSGVNTMVAYTAPVFWLFMLLVGISLFVFRRREPQRERPFRVPLYPVTPALFCLACLGLLYSSIVYAGIGGFLGLVVLASGVPFALRYGKVTLAGDGAVPDATR
ncbi:amino acid permease [Verticiella sediminum]|uniref:Amino acid permease n=1 Tax=Verticiella sediminum TaxID=1247510 RepID=A0A556A7D3_9BURK|nr:amino acid permease [Verticiella sediminum]TSH88782.1 amino acid permease [Verticiella sediminum]